MGSAHAANVATQQCYQGGILTSVEIMVNAPWFPEAVQMLAESEVDVGVHLTLSSEWDTLKWRPLSDSPSLRDADGYFYPMVFPHADFPNRALSQHPWRLDEVEREFRAQIEQVLRSIPRVSHLSSHMGCTHLHQEVASLEQRLAREYGLERSLDGVRGIGYAGPSETSAEKIESFLKMLDSLEGSQTYLFVDHPGLDTPEMQAMSHIGYAGVALDRQGVTDTWTDPRVRQRIDEERIQLIGYRDLV